MSQRKNSGLHFGIGPCYDDATMVALLETGTRMEKVEETVLRHIATEVFCSIADVEALIRGSGTTADDEVGPTTVRMLTEWEDRGWVDTAEMDPAGLLTLTEKAFNELPWLPKQQL